VIANSFAVLFMSFICFAQALVLLPFAKRKIGWQQIKKSLFSISIIPPKGALLGRFFAVIGLGKVLAVIGLAMLAYGIAFDR
jgi:hypothetical protein